MITPHGKRLRLPSWTNDRRSAICRTSRASCRCITRKQPAADVRSGGMIPAPAEAAKSSRSAVRVINPGLSFDPKQNNRAAPPTVHCDLVNCIDATPTRDPALQSLLTDARSSRSNRIPCLLRFRAPRSCIRSGHKPARACESRIRSYRMCVARLLPQPRMTGDSRCRILHI